VTWVGSSKDFGMKFSATLDSGEFLVGDEVKIKLELEAIKEKGVTAFIYCCFNSVRNFGRHCG
jgi:hypothetical protein